MWRAWELTRRVLLTAIIGAITIADMLHASQNVHRRLAHSRRKRKPHVHYPVRALS